MYIPTFVLYNGTYNVFAVIVKSNLINISIRN